MHADIQLTTLNETSSFARDLAAQLEPGTIVLVSGPMGAGKTTLIREVTRELVGENFAASPTFTLEHVYGAPPRQVFHLDVYRLKSWEEWLQLGFLERENLSSSVTFIEWGDQFAFETWENYFAGTGLGLKRMSLEFVGSRRRVVLA